jgi:hypothetical protein
MTDNALTAQKAITTNTGGTLTAMGADGTRYTLSIPPGALPADTTVSLTPVAEISGLQLGGGLLNGVQFAPEGLILNTPATLTIVPANPLPLTQFIGFGYTALGDHFHLEPMEGDGTTVIMAVRHFSGMGTAKASAAEATGFSQQYEPSWLADSYSQQLATLVAQYRDGQIDQATFEQGMGEAISGYYQTVVNPQLTAGLDSDAAFTSGAQRSPDCRRTHRQHSTRTSWTSFGRVS